MMVIHQLTKPVSWLERVLAGAQDDTRAQPWREMFSEGTVNRHQHGIGDEGIYNGQMMQDNGGG